ncbi:MAG: hypothetical protein QTN59_17995 [Candidatus Electrothrix communis]|nr:MAG: hypothetical protein QTN59_17995 [Candidatus Electrothrix communis]
MHKNNQLEIPQEQINQGRRSTLRKIAAGTVVLAGYSALPDKWTTPLVEFGALPAHATTSGLQELIELVEERYQEGVAEDAAGDAAQETASSTQGTAQEAAAPTLKAEASETTESNDLRGYSNELTLQDSGAVMSCDKVLQHKIVFPKLGPQYGSSLLLVWSDGNELYVPDSRHMAMEASQNDYRKYQPGGAYSGNNPDIPTMEVYAKRGTHPSSVTLYY